MYNFNSAMEFIESFSKLGGAVTSLNRFKSLMQNLNSPQEKLKIIHIAGTNGKGSVGRFLAEPLIQAGFKVGEYTSPFIQNYRDRIRINGKWISEKDVAEICPLIQKAISPHEKYSQFEITTAIAFIYFARENCDIICLETGIGGLLDATNIIEKPLISIITSISFDHVAILGDTLEKIAFQKAGIIKDNSMVITSADNIDINVLNIISKTAQDKNTRVIIPDAENLAVQQSSIFGSKFIYKGISFTISMGGECQIYNAITAVEGIFYLRTKGFIISDKVLINGILKAKVPLRMEVISNTPLIILDGGHNPAGINALARAVLQSDITEPITVIIGMVKGKDVLSSIAQFKKFADTVYTADDFAAEAVDSKTLAEMSGGTAFPSFKAAFKAALKLKNPIVIGGSLYLASYALSELNKLEGV